MQRENHGTHKKTSRRTNKTNFRPEKPQGGRVALQVEHRVRGADVEKRQAIRRDLWVTEYRPADNVMRS